MYEDERIIKKQIRISEDALTWYIPQKMVFPHI